MPLRNPLIYPLLYVRASMALGYAKRRDLTGLEFAEFGRSIGKNMLWQGVRGAVGLLLTPVSSTRYFEFPFVQTSLPDAPARCLDISSPRLFSLYFAHQNRSCHIDVMNPDVRDADQTRLMAEALALKNMAVRTTAVDALVSSPERYDCIWSISVVEHIAGEYDDSQAVQWMFEALKEGGRLILTVPVAREYRDEYRTRNHYGTQPASGNGRYFFQRFYDRDSIWTRLLRPIGREPETIRWFGEVTPGRFDDYIRLWRREGMRRTVDDPREIVDHYKEYATYEEMPGVGVCGLMVQKR